MRHVFLGREGHYVQNSFVNFTNTICNTPKNTICSVETSSPETSQARNSKDLGGNPQRV